jgi:hypothetical protein
MSRQPATQATSRHACLYQRALAWDSRSGVSRFPKVAQSFKTGLKLVDKSSSRSDETGVVATVLVGVQAKASEWPMSAQSAISPDTGPGRETGFVATRRRFHDQCTQPSQGWGTFAKRLRRSGPATPSSTSLGNRLLGASTPDACRTMKPKVGGERHGIQAFAQQGTCAPTRISLGCLTAQTQPGGMRPATGIPSDGSFDLDGSQRLVVDQWLRDH